MHFGVKGMKWGVRRAQKSNDKTASKCRDNSAQDKASRRKKVIAIGASVVALSLAAYGTYKFGQVKAAKIQAGNAAVDALMDSLRNSSQMFSGSTKVNKLVFGDSDSKILSNGKRNFMKQSVMLTELKEMRIMLL